MANDLERFRLGEKKLASILAASPNEAEALSWRAASDLWLAIQANSRNDTAEGKRLYSTALEGWEKAERLGAKSPAIGAVHAIGGASWTYFAPKLPLQLQQDAYQRGRRHFLALRQLQSEFWDKLPVHHRGEVLAGLAESSARLGLNDDAALKEIIATLPDSPYAARARKWQENPALASKSTLTCMTCHEPGRLANQPSPR
jgi:hypothetical protein